MFQPFQKYIQRAANRYGVGKELAAAEICHHFRELVPQIFSEKETPEQFIQVAYFKDSRLVVNVESPAWGQEVIMRKERIIEEMNKKAGKNVIKALHTKLKN